MKNRFNLFLGTFAVIAMTQSAHAVSATWNGSPTDATWATATNWSATPAPAPGTGDTATFDNAGGAVDVIDLGAGVTIGNITFDNALVAAYTIGSGTVGTQPLTLENSGAITASSFIAANQLFNAKLVLGTDATGGSYSITNNSTTNTLTFAAGIAGGTTGTAGAKTLNVSTAAFANGGITLSGAITNGGADSLALAFAPVSGSVQVNLGNTGTTYSGGTSISSGVRLNVSGGTGKGLGTGLVTVASGGQAYLNSAGTYTNNFAISGTGTDALGAIRIGPVGTNIFNGNITLNANSSIGVDSGRFATINGNLTGGAFNLTKVSTGTVGLGSPLTLAGNNDYSGTTTVTSGVLSFAKKASLYTSNTGDWIPAKISVAANTGLALGVGDSASGYWNAAEVTTFLGATQMGTSTPTTGFKTSSYIGFDTTNATAGTFTYGAIGNIGTALTNGVVKLGTGTLVLDAANTYTGGTAVLVGTLNLASTGSINGSIVTVNPGATFSNTGGTAAFSSTVNPTGGTVSQSSGITTTPTVTTSGSGGFGFIHITGGSFTASSSISLGRSFDSTTAPNLAAPLVAPTNSGLYINGTTAAVSTATLNVGTANSSSSTRVDAGSLTVTGAVTLGKYSAASTRYSVLQVEGGIFSAVDTTNGVIIAPNGGTNNQAGAAEFYLSGGTSTVGRIAFGAGTDTVGGNGFLILGKTTETPTLYVGSGGIVKATTIGAYTATIGLTSGTLGAAADWSSSLNMTLGTNPTIKAADSADVAHNITLSGVLSGTGFTKTGAGTLTLTGPNSYTGNTTVSAGTLSLGDGTANTTLPDGAAVSISAAGTLNLNFLAANSDTVDKLFIDGVQKAAGIWGSTTSGAPNTDTHFTGPGTLTVTTPPAGGFSSWIDNPAFGLSPGQKGATADPDSDGIENLLEFVLNGTPSASDPAILPDLVVTATHFEFTFPRRDDSLSPETTQTFQYGTDLDTWTSVVVPAGNETVGAATITVTDGTPADTVKVSIPKSTVAPATKLFGRLQVTK